MRHLSEEHLELKFWKKTISGEGGCILWSGCMGDKGYGRVKRNKKWVGAHRVAYLFRNKEIPSGFEIDHLCRNKRCVNPEHLEAVSHRDNILRGAAGILRKNTTTSKYIGVHWNSKKQRWITQLTVSGKLVFLGRFISENDAAKAYSEALITFQQSHPPSLQYPGE